MKKFLTFLVVCSLSFSAFAQGITTASDFFKSVSDYYATISSYEVDIDIKAGRTEMSGHVSFKRPEMLRIDFTDPAEQVILFNGDDLTIYLPGSSAILEQAVGDSGENVAQMLGLGLLRRYYSVAYEVGQDPVALDEDSDEFVIKLVLSRRSTTEAFKNIDIAIDPATKLMRRLVAVTPQNEQFVFDFSGYQLNTNMSDQRFIYDPPSSANNYKNFLLSE